jgi:hypothetical protein
MRQLIYRAMHQADDLVVTFDYTDANEYRSSCLLRQPGRRQQR